MADHRATDEQWGAMYEGAFHCDAESACILELRARVEALEENATADIVDYYAALSTQHQGRAVFHDNSKPSPNFSQIGSSLVERVVRAAGNEPFDSRSEARAAILEVAAWLREQGTPACGWAMRLEQEANR